MHGSVRFRVAPTRTQSRRGVRGMAYGLVWGLVLAANTTAGQPALAKATADQCRETLQQALQDKNPDTRKQAVMAVSLAGAQFLLPVKGMLQDEDVQVRLAAVETLAVVKGPQAVAALRAALDDAAPEVGFAAARALWGLHDTAGREALLAVLGGRYEVGVGSTDEAETGRPADGSYAADAVLVCRARGDRIRPCSLSGTRCLVDATTLERSWCLGTGNRGIDAGP